MQENDKVSSYHVSVNLIGLTSKKISGLKGEMLPSLIPLTANLAAFKRFYSKKGIKVLAGK